jgi:hypothetical protein
VLINDSFFCDSTPCALLDSTNVSQDFVQKIQYEPLDKLQLQLCDFGFTARRISTLYVIESATCSIGKIWENVQGYVCGIIWVLFGKSVRQKRKIRHSNVVI